MNRAAQARLVRLAGRNFLPFDVEGENHEVNVLKPHLQTTVWTLLKAGNSRREIERRTKISRHTIRAWAKRFAAQSGPPEDSNCSGVATDSTPVVATQTAPPRPPTPTTLATVTSTSLCEPHRAFIEAQLQLGRNAMAIYQELVDTRGAMRAATTRSSTWPPSCGCGSPSSSVG